MEFIFLGELIRKDGRVVFYLYMDLKFRFREALVRNGKGEVVNGEVFLVRESKRFGSRFFSRRVKRFVAFNGIASFFFIEIFIEVEFMMGKRFNEGFSVNVLGEFFFSGLVFLGFWFLLGALFYNCRKVVRWCGEGRSFGVI